MDQQQADISERHEELKKILLAELGGLSDLKYKERQMMKEHGYGIFIERKMKAMKRLHISIMIAFTCFILSAVLMDIFDKSNYNVFCKCV